MNGLRLPHFQRNPPKYMFYFFICLCLVCNCLEKNTTGECSQWQLCLSKVFLWDFGDSGWTGTVSITVW